MVDAIKTWSYHGHLLDQKALLFLELRDVLWYLALISSVFGWPLEHLVAANVAKLRKRYPEGFETERSVHWDARAIIVRGMVLGRSNRGETPPMLPLWVACVRAWCSFWGCWVVEGSEVSPCSPLWGTESSWPVA